MSTPHPHPSPGHHPTGAHDPSHHQPQAAHEHHGHHEHHHHHSSRHNDPHHQELLAQWRREHDARNRVVIRNGLIWLGGTLLVVAIVGWFWFDALQRQQAEREAVHAAQAALRAELLAPEALVPDRAEELLRRIDATRAEWRDSGDARLIERRADEARALLATEQAKRSLRTDLANIEQALAAPVKVLDTWRQLHDREAAMRARLPDNADDLRLQLDEVADRIDSGWIDALLAAASAKDTNPRMVLQYLTAAADLAEASLDADHRDPGHQLFWRQRSKQVVPRLDAAQTVACDAAAIAAAQWQHLLPGSTEDDWVPSRGANLIRRMAGDTLHLECQAGAGSRSIVVRLRADPWHACALAFDLQLDRGRATLFGRATHEFDARASGALSVATAAEPGAAMVGQGQPVVVEMVLVGDRVVADIATTPPQHLELKVTHQERRGTFALVLQPDTKVTLRKLRVKRLG